MKVDKTSCLKALRPDMGRRLVCGWWLILLAASPLAVSAFAGEAVPAAWPQERYTALAGQSPFAVASATPPPVETRGSFAQNWFVTGLGRLQGRDFVSIKARDLSTQFSLTEGDSRNGVSLVRVVWTDQVGKSTVVLRKGQEIAEITFNEAELRAPAVAANQGSAPGKTGSPAAARGVQIAGTGMVVPSASPGTGALIQTPSGRRVPAQIARWMSRSTPQPAANGGLFFAGVSGGSDGGSSGVSSSSSGGTAQTSAPLSSSGDSVGGGSSGSLPVGNTSGAAVVDFGNRPASSSAGVSSPINAARSADARVRIPPAVSQWLTPAAQSTILQWRSELVE